MHQTKTTGVNSMLTDGWINENKITKQPLAENTGFSNDYIK